MSDKDKYDEFLNFLERTVKNDLYKDTDDSDLCHDEIMDIVFKWTARFYESNPEMFSKRKKI